MRGVNLEVRMRLMLERVARMPAPPCDRFRCCQRERCAAMELQCRAFEHYVRSGAPCVPARRPKLFALTESEVSDAAEG